MRTLSNTYLSPISPDQGDILDKFKEQIMALNCIENRSFSLDFTKLV